MALKLNTTRTFKQTVNLRFLDEEGKIKTGTFTATFRNLLLKKEEVESQESLLDRVLVSIHGLELEDENGNILEGEDLITVAKMDMDIAEALVEAFNAAIEKKRVKRTTSKKP